MDNNSVISDPNTPPRSPHLPSTSSPNPSTTITTAASSSASSSTSILSAPAMPAPPASSSSASSSSAFSIITSAVGKTKAVHTTSTSDENPRPSKMSRTSQTTSNTALLSFFNTPWTCIPEVLLLVGNHLHRRELASCVRVSKLWHKTFYMFFWTTIGRHQWRSASFPLLDPESDSNVEFNLHRHHIVKLAWADVDNVAVGWSRLVGMLNSMPNLIDVSLSARLFSPPQTLHGFLQNTTSRPKMKNIYLNFGRFMGQEALPIRSVLPDCELLESLGIEGEWFREETKQEFEEHPEPWCLQRLITPRSHLQIVRRCPELRAITLSARLDLDAETSIAPITTCGNLQELHFSGVNGFRVNNFREVLPQVQSLTALTIEHVTQEHFARLDVLQNATSAPRLKVLVLGRIGVAMGGELLAKENQQLLVNILQAHQGLETFELKGLSINVLSFFTSIEGDQHKAFCPCPQLKKLSLEIHTTSMLESNPATMNSLWELVYTQLGRMNQLETLMLKSSGLKVTVEAGFLLLGKTTKLKSLTLSDPNRPTWTVSGLKRLLAVAPELRTLDLKPLTPSHRRQINAWFKAHEKGFLRF